MGPSGSEAPSWLHSPPSSRCGSPSRSTTSAAPPLSTASASKHLFSCGRKTTYWILSPTSSPTCQWGSPLFSIQPYFHCLSSGLRSFHSTLYYIPSSILTLPLNKMSHFGTFVTSLTVYWHH